VSGYMLKWFMCWLRPRTVTHLGINERQHRATLLIRLPLCRAATQCKL